MELEGACVIVTGGSRGIGRAIAKAFVERGARVAIASRSKVEVEAVTDSCGVRGLQTGEAPLHLKGILEKRFVWHELVADAAVKGDHKLKGTH